MNASAKWLRRALLGGVALGAMTIGAQADELSALKAQLEALQSRVNQLESTGPAASAGAPAGASYLSFSRGSDIYQSSLKTNRLDLQDTPGDRGFTIGITPTADLPAPIMEVAISGYVLMLASYDTHSDVASSGGGAIASGGDDEHFQMDALRTRIRITSRSDTAIGQIRTLIEGDFRDVGTVGNQVLRMRYGWGEWDMTPDTTFGAGQFLSTNYHGVGETPMVNWIGQYGAGGFNKTWVPQVQIKHVTGPYTWAIGLMDPRDEVAGQDTQLPDLGARVTGSIGSVSFGIGGVVREIHADSNGLGAGTNDSEVGVGINGGIDIPFGDMITLHAFGGWGDGATDITGSVAAGARFTGGQIRTNESVGAGVGLSFRLSEASSINANYSMVHASRKNLASAVIADEEQVAVNYIWQPVSKMRMGVEALWREETRAGGADEDNLRLTFGTWFFF